MPGTPTTNGAAAGTSAAAPGRTPKRQRERDAVAAVATPATATTTTTTTTTTKSSSKSKAKSKSPSRRATSSSPSTATARETSAAAAAHVDETGDAKRNRQPSSTSSSSTTTTATTTTTTTTTTTRAKPLTDEAIRAAAVPQLDVELARFAARVTPTDKEMAERKRLVEVVTEVAKSLWPKCQVTAFGSSVVGLALAGSSDVDVIIFGAPPHGLRSFAAAVRAQKLVDHADVLDRASVPIVKLQFAKSPYTVDIVFGEQSGLGSTQFIRERLSEPGATKSLRPVVLALKHVLAENGLNRPFTGGFGSYVTFLLVMAAAQSLMRDDRGLASGKSSGGGGGDGSSGTGAQPPPSPGAVLLRFFETWSGRAALNVAASLRGAGWLLGRYASPLAPYFKADMLVVEDPVDPSRNAAAGAWDAVRVCGALEVMHLQLLSRMRRFAENSAATVATNAQFPLLSSFLSIPSASSSAASS